MGLESTHNPSGIFVGTSLKKVPGIHIYMPGIHDVLKFVETTEQSEPYLRYIGELKASLMGFNGAIYTSTLKPVKIGEKNLFAQAIQIAIFDESISSICEEGYEYLAGVRIYVQEVDMSSYFHNLGEIQEKAIGIDSNYGSILFDELFEKQISRDLNNYGDCESVGIIPGKILPYASYLKDDERKITGINPNGAFAIAVTYLSKSQIRLEWS